MGEFTGSWSSDRAQKTVAEKPEFSGTGKFVDTNDLVRPGKESPTGESHNEFKNGETYFLIGDALDKGILLMFTKWTRHQTHFLFIYIYEIHHPPQSSCHLHHTLAGFASCADLVDAG